MVDNLKMVKCCERDYHKNQNNQELQNIVFNVIRSLNCDFQNFSNVVPPTIETFSL